MISKPRVQSDGSIVYRKHPGICPQGYEEDPNDDCRFLPLYRECIHRERDKTITLPCGKKAVRDYCNLFQLVIDRNHCNNICKEKGQ